MSASIVSRPCLAAAAASRARLVSRAARASTASSSSNDKLHARAHPIQVRGLAQIARAKKGGFMAEMEEEGLVDCGYARLTQGIACLHWGTVAPGRNIGAEKPSA